MRVRDPKVLRELKRDPYSFRWRGRVGVSRRVDGYIRRVLPCPSNPPRVKCLMSPDIQGPVAVYPEETLPPVPSPHKVGSGLQSRRRTATGGGGTLIRTTVDITSIIVVVDSDRGVCRSRQICSIVRRRFRDRVRDYRTFRERDLDGLCRLARRGTEGVVKPKRWNGPVRTDGRDQRDTHVTPPPPHWASLPFPPTKGRDG